MKANPRGIAQQEYILPLVSLVFQVVCFPGDASRAAPAAKAQGEQPVYDVVVYGDSSGAVIAAVAAKREGRSIVLVNPTGFLGGMSSSGLSATDFLGKRNTYGGIASESYERLLGGPARHYDFTLLRVVKPGLGTYPHCDAVYMGRGTFNLFTAWTPLGDIPLDVGGLMILENSHRQADKLQAYLQRDVDVYCTNHADAGLIESGQKQWQDWDGRLSSNPVTLREKLGGRWLTADFKAGDLLTFGMATVHASLDNQSSRLRLSSDSRYQLASEPADERWIGPNPSAHGPAGKKGKVC